MLLVICISWREEIHDVVELETNHPAQFAGLMFALPRFACIFQSSTLSILFWFPPGDFLWLVDHLEFGHVFEVVGVLGALSSLWWSTRQMIELLISCYCVHDDYHCDPTHGFPATMIDMQIILHAKAYLPNESMMWHLPRLFFMLIIRQSELIVVGACGEWRNRRCHYH